MAKSRANTSLTFGACQGATTNDIVNSQKWLLNADTDIVTLTIGGNDIGFGNLIINCAGSYSPNCKTEVDETDRKIHEELPAKLDKAYAAIKSRAPGARVVVLGYGKFFSTNLSCAGAEGISAEEAGWANDLTDNLDAVIRGRATAAGFAYQSSISRFTGHAICSADPYVNGKNWSVADMYHPTRSGHANGLTPLVHQVVG